MKVYLIFAVCLLLNLHNYEVEGIRLRKTTLPVSSHHAIIKMISVKVSNDQDHELLNKADEVPSGTNRKLMKTITSSSTSTTNSKNQKPNGIKSDPKEVASEPYPNDTDIMDYTPARKRTPLHN